MRGSLALAERLDAGARGIAPDAGTLLCCALRRCSCHAHVLPPRLADDDDAGGAAVGALQAALQDQQRRLSVACAQTAEYASASLGRAPKRRRLLCAPRSTTLRHHQGQHLTPRAPLRPPASKEEEAKALLSQVRRGWQRRFSCAALRRSRAAP